MTDAPAVHVWRIPLPLASSNHLSQAWDTVLTPDDLARAARFRFDADRVRWLGTRVAVRALLGRHLRCDPQQIPFVCGPHGKPALPSGFGRLHFNWSHTDNLALLAVSQDAEVGADAERLRADFDPLALAPSVFSPNEMACLLHVDPAGRHALFFRFWTGKEALLKALGTGLMLAPTTVCLAALARGDTAQALKVTVRILPGGGSHISAIAARAENFHFYQHDWHTSCSPQRK